MLEQDKRHQLMIPKPGRKITVSILLILAAGALLTGCGKKAPPRAPVREEAPAAVGRLSKSVSGDMLRLTWNLAAGNSGNVAGFYVYRSKMRLADPYCRTCPVLFRRIDAIPYEGQGTGGGAPGPFEYREILEAGYRYIYKVAVYSSSGLVGKDSDTVELTR